MGHLASLCPWEQPRREGGGWRACRELMLAAYDLHQSPLPSSHRLYLPQLSHLTTLVTHDHLTSLLVLATRKLSAKS